MMIAVIFTVFAVLLQCTTAMPAPATAFGIQPSRIARAITAASTGPATAAPTNINSISNQFITIPGVTNSHVNIAPQTITLHVPTCVQTITPDSNGYVPPGTCGALWDYYPNFAAALLFAVLFAALTTIHIWQAARYKKVSAIMVVGEPIKG